MYVANGSLDCGLAGWDWIVENRCQDRVRILADLCYSKQSFRPVRWVLAVANDSAYQTTADLRNVHPPIRISTELRNITEDWLSERGIIADVKFSWGATEAKVPVFADAIVDCTETGSSLRANGLRIVETVIESTTRFFVNNEVYKSDEWKRSKVDGIALLLKSCLAAETKETIHLEAARPDAEKIKGLIPSSATFTVWEGQDDRTMFEIILEKEISRDLVPALARSGAKRISVTSLGMLYE